METDLKNRTPTHRRKGAGDLKAFCKALKTYDHYLLSCHVAPEGDAIGSILAMNSLLRRLGKKTSVVSEDPFPERLSCLSSKYWKQVDQIRAAPPRFQALVLADCPNLDRIGRVKQLLNPDTVIFNIDHHISNLYFGHYNYVRPEAAASGEVVFDIFKSLRLALTKEEATNLYVALSTDTGSFKYSNTSARSHLMAAELIRCGIRLEQINEGLNATYSLSKINLYSRLFSRVRTAENGRIAWVVLKREDLRDSGATYEDTEGFIDFLKYLREVKIAFFLIESSQDSEIRVSFRSKDDYDVNKIAASFEGGGHKKAAGCTFRGATVEEAERIILERLRREFSSR